MKIPAGPPAPSEGYIEDRIDLGEYLAPHPNDTFLVRVEGDSMIDLGIHPDDLLVVERSREAKNGDVVIASVNGEFTVKQFRRHSGNLWLVSANKNHPTPKQQDFEVRGIVRYSIHRV